MKNAKQLLGNRAHWGRVGYSGEGYAPTPGTYPGIDALGLRYTTIQDSGQYPMPGEKGELANLTPLIAAMLNEVGFAWEAGPMTTWSN